MLNSLTIENFTAFRRVQFEFVPGINVLVGANASGKTHVLKLAYVMQSLQRTGTDANRDVQGTLMRTFRPEAFGDLIRGESKPRSADVAASWNGLDYAIKIIEPISHAFDASTHPVADMIREGQLTPYMTIATPGKWDGVTEPVFIPVKDMLAHSVGFLSLYDQRYIDFDETHRSILSLAFLPTLRENGRKAINPLLDKLADKMEGRVEVKGERFYINGEKGRFEMHMVAEGWRKIALLYQLIANGSIAAGTVLYWDEPEANLNPSLMDEVIGILLELSRMGVQIFLATHSYVMLKELELQKQEKDSLTFIAMARNKKDGSVSIHPAATYSEIHPNLIAEQFERIYDMEVDRALGKQ